jgi:3-hydroxybutyryl-CoA dehydrogenase
MEQISIRGLAVIGAGTMGAGIAESALVAGLNVLLVDADDAAVARGQERIAASLARDVARGRRSPAERDAALTHLTTATTLEACAVAPFVVEAVWEDVAVKRQLFAQLDASCPPSTILATNTSSLSVAQIANATQHPARVVGMHFFNPVPRMRLVEVVGGPASSQDAVEQATALAQRLGKTPIRASDAPGFIVNRVARPFYLEALRLLEAGAISAELDRALRGVGFPMGPCELMDLVGLDINLATSESLWTRTYGQPRLRPSWLQRSMVDAGLLGQKVGRGFYQYPRPKVADAPPVAITAQFSMIGDSALAAALALPEGAGGQPIVALADDQLLAGSGFAVGARRLHQGASVVEFVGEVPDETRAQLAAVAQRAGLASAWVPDLPGGAALRLLACLINEAAFAVSEGVASAEAIDQAMQLGANHPRGPWGWAAELGLGRVLRVLDALRATHGDAYVAAPLLRRRAAQGETKPNT